MVMLRTYLALNRFGLGWRAGDASPARDVAAMLGADLKAYNPAPDSLAALAPRRVAVETFKNYRDDRRAAREGEAMGMGTDPETIARDVRVHYLDAAAARLQQAAATDTPFAERLVHFWSNHFAVSVQSLPVAALAGDFENAAIRPHIMGKFGDLLKAAALHPAMLLFLDQAQSVGPGSLLAQRVGARAAAGEGRRLGLNENLAREILELHTLGVNGGYVQADVTAFARALTGWTVAGLGQRPDQLLRRMGVNADPGDAVFVPAMHEPGTQRILGKSYGETDRAQALAVLDDLARHPATARHIATKLARHFAADTPPPTLVAKLERAYIDSGGDLPTLYRTLIDAPESWQTATPKFKTPWDWTVSMLRATGIKQLPDRRGAVGALAQLGQPIWQPGSPAGFDDIADRWAGASGLMLRAELASRVAGGIAARTDPRSWGAAIMADGASEATLAAIARADSPAQGVVLALMAPEFLRR
ncbi:MAG: DUF1800 domain-containing protein [Sphingopyxis sp.]|nr:DUF1800 domain-containing protein [Sphingopyxis sp.]